MKDKDLMKARNQIFKVIDLKSKLENSYVSACAMRDHVEALKLKAQLDILDVVWTWLEDALPKEQ